MRAATSQRVLVLLCVVVICAKWSPAATVTVAACQIQPKRFDVPANLAKIEQYVQRAASLGAQICVSLVVS